MVNLREPRIALPLATVLASLAVSSCGASSESGGSGEPHQWKYATYGPPAQIDTVIMKTWEEEMNKALPSGVEIQYFNSESLFKAPETMDATGAGVADIAFVAPAYSPKEMPLGSVASLPFQTRDPEAVSRALMQLYDEYEPFKNEWQDQNLHLLFAVPFPPMIVSSTAAIEGVEDLDGLAVRGHGVSMDVFGDVGAEVVALTAPEIYEGLQRGVIDAAGAMTLPAASDYSLYEVAPYVTDPGTGVYATVGIAMNLDVWNALSSDEQEVIENYRDEWMDEAITVVMQSEAEACKVLLDAGGTVHAFDPEEVDEWEATSGEEAVAEWIEASEELGAPAGKFYELYSEAIATHEESSSYVPGIDVCAEKSVG